MCFYTHVRTHQTWESWVVQNTPDLKYDLCFFRASTYFNFTAWCASKVRSSHRHWGFTSLLIWLVKVNALVYDFWMILCHCYVSIVSLFHWSSCALSGTLALILSRQTFNRQAWTFTQFILFPSSINARLFPGHFVKPNNRRPKSTPLFLLKMEMKMEERPEAAVWLDRGDRRGGGPGYAAFLLSPSGVLRLHFCLSLVTHFTVLHHTEQRTDTKRCLLNIPRVKA